MFPDRQAEFFREYCYCPMFCQTDAFFLCKDELRIYNIGIVIIRKIIDPFACVMKCFDPDTEKKI